MIAISSMMVLGFLAGLLCEVRFLQGLIIPFTFLMIYPMMVVLKIKKVIEGGDAKAQVLTQVINFAVIPFVAYEIGAIFFSGKPFWRWASCLLLWSPQAE